MLRLKSSGDEVAHHQQDVTHRDEDVGDMFHAVLLLTAGQPRLPVHGPWPDQ
jgi:hypothetical protein